MDEFDILNEYFFNSNLFQIENDQQDSFIVDDNGFYDLSDVSIIYFEPLPKLNRQFFYPLAKHIRNI